ncbi:CACTA en-spm transposon protein [Cucumis melo var. makuwa]|uniref:CACTA en-spm transposon protein n=1 Tax=Cucumis melo var. makuwa TaxID=1194695 RepID=A0A5A7V1G7_CUCMM|nr:CACTA en-spm transposon protein [Cucumis melo var. makuwa]
MQEQSWMNKTAEDAYNQMLELQPQPTPEGSQPLYGDEICETIVLSRRPSYSKGLGCGPNPKYRKTTSVSSFSTMFSQASDYELQ